MGWIWRIAKFVIFVYLLVTSVLVLYLFQTSRRYLNQISVLRELINKQQGILKNRSRVISHQYDKIANLSYKVSELKNKDRKLVYFESNPKVRDSNGYKKPLYLKIAEEVAGSHEYDANNYNCADFSEELVRELEKEGYNADHVIKTVNCDSGSFDKEICEQYDGKHEFVKVIIYLEAVTGKIINPDNYEDYGI